MSTPIDGFTTMIQGAANTAFTPKKAEMMRVGHVFFKRDFPEQL